MKNVRIFFLLTLALASCKKNREATPVLSLALNDCLTSQVEAFKADQFSVAVLTIISQGEQVYWFKTVPGCGSGNVLNENCEIVCRGGKHDTAFDQNCPQADLPDWEVVWEK